MASFVTGKEKRDPESNPNDKANVNISDDFSWLAAVAGMRVGACIKANDIRNPLDKASKACTVSE